VGVDNTEAQQVVAEIMRALQEYHQPIDQTVEPVTIRTPDGTPVMECTSQYKGAWRETPILVLDDHSSAIPNLHQALKDAGLPVIIVNGQEELRKVLTDRGLSEREIREKLTGLTHPMRSDAELSGLAEVVRAMPAIKVNNPGKSTRRPALPKNRKRDRWN
jgi:hypothetical protein